jgi:osmotically-inducible protein OsmY
MKFAPYILAAALAATLSACADMKMTPAGPVPEGRVATADGALADAVRWELSTMSIKGITVTTKDGEVTLKGDVATGQQLADIAMAVQKIAGVKAVIPDVNVKG